MSQETQRIIGVLFGAHCPKGGGGGSGWREIEEENQRRSMVGIPDPRSPSKKKIYLTEDRGCLFSLNKTDLLRHHDKVETKGKQVTSKAIKTVFFHEPVSALRLCHSESHFVVSDVHSVTVMRMIHWVFTSICCSAQNSATGLVSIPMFNRANDWHSIMCTFFFCYFVFCKGKCQTKNRGKKYWLVCFCDSRN